MIGLLFGDDRAFMANVVGRTGMFSGSTGRAMEMDMENFVLLAELLGQGQATGEINSISDPLQLAEILTATFMLTITNWITGWWGDVGELTPDSCALLGSSSKGVRRSKRPKRGARARLGMKNQLICRRLSTTNQKG